jgi:hypothetical protein
LSSSTGAGFQVGLGFLGALCQRFLFLGMLGDQVFGQLQEGILVAGLGHFDQRSLLVVRQATELAKFAVTDAHAGHAFEGLFAEISQVGNRLFAAQVSSPAGCKFRPGA